MGNWAVWTYLLVATSGLLTQTFALIKIIAQPMNIGPARNGLRRTASCRVLAFSTYFILGIMALFYPLGTGKAAFFDILLMMLMWQANGVLDTRLAGRLGRAVAKKQVNTGGTQ